MIIPFHDACVSERLRNQIARKNLCCRERSLFFSSFIPSSWSISFVCPRKSVSGGSLSNCSLPHSKLLGFPGVISWLLTIRGYKKTQNKQNSLGQLKLFIPVPAAVLLERPRRFTHWFFFFLQRFQLVWHSLIFPHTVSISSTVSYFHVYVCFKYREHCDPASILLVTVNPLFLQR